MRKKERKVKDVQEQGLSGRVGDVIECDEDELDALHVRVTDMFSNTGRMDPWDH
jgi:hypothetical protein